MSKKSILLIIGISISICINAQLAVSKQEQEVRKTVIDFFQSLSDRDSIALKSHSTTDIILLENGAVWNADSLILKAIIMNTDVDFKRTNSFDFIGTTIHTNTAWVSYNLLSVFSGTKRQGTVHWMETVVLIKDKNKWKINLLHSTLIKRS